MCVCMCVCVWVGGCLWVCGCGCMCVGVWVCVWVGACVRACVRACVHACLCARVLVEINLSWDIISFIRSIITLPLVLTCSFLIIFYYGLWTNQSYQRNWESFINVKLLLIGYLILNLRSFYEKFDKLKDWEIKKAVELKHHIHAFILS